jgi:tetratricopeptide (TPR) repeat protein
MNESFIAPPPSASEARPRDTKAPSRALLDDEELACIVRIVRATLQAENAKKEVKPTAPLWRRAAPFCLEHWALTAFVASVLVLIGAAIGYRASPFYWFKQIAVADAELDGKRAKFDFDRSMAYRQIGLGESFLDVWRHKDAAKAFDDALKLDPASIPASFGLFKANMFADAASGAYDAEVAERRLRLILDVEPNDPHALAALGDNFYFQEDWGEAREYYRRALAQRRFAHALSGLGMVELKNGKYAEAAGPLAEAAKLSPSNWKYLDNLAFVQSRTGEVRPAIATYEALSRLDPEALLGRGCTCSRATSGPCAPFSSTWPT